MKHQSVIAVLCLGLVLSGLDSPAEDASPPYQTGEKLTYHFYWGLFLVGYCTFEVTRNGEDRQVFTVQGKSNDFVSTIYPVVDVVSSEFDPRDMRSVRFMQNRREGRRHYWEETFFYHPLRRGSTQSYITGEALWFDLPEGAVQDKLSIIYFMRCKDWRRNSEHGATIGSDKGPLKVNVRKITVKTIELDDFAPIPAFQVEPDVNYLSGFLKKAKVRAWVSDDKFKVPIRINIEARFGTLTVELVKVEGIEAWPYEKK